MKLKPITKLLFVIISVFALSSCNSSDTEYTTGSLSGDAQIYSFKIDAKPFTAIDTINYPALAKTRFAIDQQGLLIYNPDSLPYRTVLRKCLATVAFPSTISKFQLIYPKDSIVDWNATDSVDFSTYLYPKFSLSPQNGQESPRIYTVKILIHQENPDTMVWRPKTTTGYPTTISNQKTLLVNNTFYTFITTGDNVYLYTADKPATQEGTLAYTRQNVSGLNASKLNLESIIFFNDKFFAVNDGKGYVADINGTNWSKKNDAVAVTNIIGVLPTTKAETDSLLIITNEADGPHFAKTRDMQTILVKGKVNEDFPLSGYSSVTNYDRNNLNNCILAVTGGASSANYAKTWSLKTTDKNILEVISNQSNPTFPKKAGISTFLYDGYMYALTGNQLYKTVSYGYKWIKAPSVEKVDLFMPVAHGQSVIVDSDNFIWVFGGIRDSGTNPVVEVWTGRLNKLKAKK
ncbi:DUF6242 domain-containing protein [Prevotella sp. 10(H)]|uniref:DUF6242 domain-containing protein n=1 Tax=Prevotella sp. 10(H) TaxID=1158294 RepID=UPI0004A71FEC|nr:DUF6242 domain-containing protein [Prevotella sp. 10(H)]